MKLKKLIIQTQEILQGDFLFKELNLMLVFQVNCPGCFVYALPVALEFQEKYKEKNLKILGLSTAFEDYEFNTIENTKKLLKDGTLVGVTKETLIQAGYAKFPYKIPFDLAFDKLEKVVSKNFDKEIEDYCRKIEGFLEQDKKTQDRVREQVRHYLEGKQFTAITFDQNYLNGTPSWILFNKSKEILFECFGHKNYEELKKIVDKHL